MVGTWKSQITVTIVCFRHVNRNQMNVLLNRFCSISELYCLLATDVDRDQRFPTPFLLRKFTKCSPAL